MQGDKTDKARGSEVYELDRYRVDRDSLVRAIHEIPDRTRQARLEYSIRTDMQVEYLPVALVGEVYATARAALAAIDGPHRCGRVRLSLVNNAELLMLKLVAQPRSGLPGGVHQRVIEQWKRLRPRVESVGGRLRTFRYRSGSSALRVVLRLRPGVL